MRLNGLIRKAFFFFAGERMCLCELVFEVLYGDTFPE